MPQIIIYLFNRAHLGLLSELETYLSKLKLDYPRDIVYFKAVPERKKFVVFLRENKFDLIGEIDRLVKETSKKYSISLENKISCKSERGHISPNALACMIFFNTLINEVFLHCSSTQLELMGAESSKLEGDIKGAGIYEHSENITTGDLVGYLDVSKIRNSVEALGLSRSELAISLILYLLRKRRDLETILEVSNWITRMDYSEVLKMIENLEYRGLVRINTNDNIVEPSLLFIINMRKLIAIMIGALKRAAVKVRSKELNLLANLLRRREAIILDGNHMRSMNLHKVFEEILEEMNIAQDFKQRRNALLFFYLLVRDKKIINKSVLKRVIFKAIRLISRGATN